MTTDSVTLQLGDVLSIPGIDEMVIGSIKQPYPGRFQVRLDKKFHPSVEIDILAKR